MATGGRQAEGQDVKLLTDVRELSAIGYGFMASKAMFAALDLEIFSHLADGGLSEEELIRRVRLPPNGLRTLLRACTSLGLLEREGNRYLNSPAAADYLARQSPRYYGDYFRFQIDRQIYPSLMQLNDALRGRETTPLYAMMGDPEQAETFSRAQHVGSLGPARLLAQRVDAASWRQLLDVAGGSGAFSITLCQRNPRLRAAIIDFPNVVEIARREIGRAGLADRIGLFPGDALSTPWPTDQDAVLLSYLLSAIPAQDYPVLFRKAKAALRPGGVLVVHDFMLEDDRHAPLHAALWFLANTISGQGLVSFSGSDLASMLGDCGFEVANSSELLPGITGLLVASKPDRRRSSKERASAGPGAG